jgi:cell division protein ZapE
MAEAETANVTPSVLYQRGIAEQRWQNDPAQRALLPELDRIHADLIQAESRVDAAVGWWRHLRGRAAPVRGLYLWGAVGRGKTFLEDLLFQALPFEKKLRLHFHRFMGRVHAGLAKLDGHDNPLRNVATQFAAQARVFFLDEFFVADIGDAMILAELLRHLFAQGVTLITTSNVEPRQLYRDGLQRAKFLPAIALLEEYCAVIELPGAQDYRLRALTRAGVYFTPLGVAAEQSMATCFERIAAGAPRPEPDIQINGRGIALKRRVDGVIWFDFDALCDGPRAVADYIELAQSFGNVFISGVPQFSPQTEDAARRFVDLVDEFYDRGVTLVLSAATPVTELYDGERLRAEFARTESRLIEMQSQEYLAHGRRH